MRLAEFILANMESILSEWVEFARSCGPAARTMNVVALRDHAADMLATIAKDLVTPQSESERSEKSKGRGDNGVADTAAEIHGAGRAESGFTLEQIVSEFRALRASVIRLWGKTNREPKAADIDDLTRFNEAIDQGLAESIVRFAQDLDRSQQMFIAILGHDLRTPLGAIMMSASALLMKGGLSQPHQAMASRILNSGSRIQQMVNDLLDFARARVGAGIPLLRAEMNMEEVCRQTVDELAAYHSGRVLRFQSTGQTRGFWDAARVSQALSNLVGNAIQHGSSETAISVVVMGEADEVTVAIHNRGSVIPPNQIHQIFSPMTRLETDATKPREPGSLGLGLYIAQEIVRGHGGRITVDSSADQGTTFTIHLPRILAHS